MRSVPGVRLVSVQITLDTYRNLAPGLQEAAAARFDQIALSGSKKPETETAR
jgi:hypothetical protein